MHLWAHFLTALLLVAAVITAQPSTQPSLNKSEVYVPWKEFRQIIDRLAQPDTVAEDTIHAPTDYVLTSAKISGEVTDNSSARFSVRLALTVLPSLALKENGWVTVGLGRMSNRAVLEAVTVEGKVLPLHTEDGEYRLLFSKAGVYPLTLVYHCAVASDEGTSSIDIMLPKTLAAGLDFTLAGTRADITVNGTRIPVEKKGNGVRIRTPLSTDNGVHINYTPLGREESGEDTTRITPRVYAATGLLADIRENSIRYQYRVDYQIWHKKITSFAIALPDTFAIEEVQGAGIAQWKLEQREGKPVLSVATNFTPEKAYSMTIRFSRKLEKVADRIPVPSLRALNVNRENGCLAVVSQQTMEVTIADSLSRLTAVDQSELHPWMRSRNDLLMRFKYIHPPYHLSLDVKRHSDMPVLVAIADDVAFTTLLTEEGYVLSRFRYHIRNNHKQYLRVGMPGGWRLWSALIDGGPVMPATSGNEEVLIPLKKMASDDNGEGFRLELVYWKEWKKMRLRGRFSFSMPDIDINAQKISGDLWVPKQFRYTGFKGSLERSGFSAETAYRSVPDTWSTANSNMRRDRRFGKMANQQITKSRKGIALTLPVEISVPTEGTQFHFTKKLTISGEKADLSLSFRKRLPDFGKPFGLLFPIIFFLTGFICMRVSLRRRSLKSILIAFAAGLAVVIFFLLVREIFHNTYPGLSMFLLGIAAGAVAHCAYGVKRRIAESTAIVLLLAGLTLPPPAFSRDDADDENTELTGSTVAVPWSDFKQILERIRKPERYDTARPVVPPVAYVIGSGDYRGERSGEGQFLFSARLNISVLEQRSWVEIGLAQGAAVFPDVKVLFPAGGTASIGTDASGNNSLIVRGAGNYTVSFRFTAPIVEQSGVSTVRFPMPYQTAASLRLDLDKPDYRVTANGIPLAPRSAGSGHTVYEGAIGGNNSATISWQQEVSQISAQDAMLLGQVNTFCSIGLGLIQMTSEIDLSVIHQAVREFTFSLPRAVAVVDLTGPAVLTWEKVDTTGNDKTQTIRVVFKYRVKNRAAFELTAEQPYGDSVATLSLPELNLGNASRQEGFIAVAVTSNIELKQKDLSANVLRKDRRELPPWFESADDILFSYQYLSGSYCINFGISRHDNISGLAALVEREDARSVIREDGKTITELTMKVVNRGEQFLRVNWKPGRQLWSLYCNGRPARPAFDSTASELLVPLEKTAEQSAATTVKLVYLEQNRGFGIVGKHELIIPYVNMPAQNISAVVYVPTPVDMLHTSGNLHAAESEKRGKSPWFTSGFGILRELLPYYQKGIATDFYEPQPQEQVARLIKDKAPEVQQKIHREEKMKTAPARARVAQKKQGVLGVISDQTKQQQAENADIFGKGGFSNDIDALLENEAGLKDSKRKEVTGIGYAQGYGSGSGGIDDLLSGFAGGTPGQQESFTSSSSIETGQLSLPINVTFDGTSHTFSTVLLKNRESARLSFLYRKVPAKIPFVVHLLLFILTVVAGAFLTGCLWSGWSIRKALYGIAGPFALALVLCRILGLPLGIDWIVLVPALFFFWKGGVFVIGSLKARGGHRSGKLTEDVTSGEDTPVQEELSASPDDERPDDIPPVGEGGN